MRKWMLAAVAAGAAVITGTGSTAALAAPAAARVPCDTAALAAAISGAAPGAVISLTAGCGYVLTAALPAITQDLTITGNGATLKRSTAPGTPAFSILTVTGGALTVGDLDFRNGGGSAAVSGGAIEETGDGQLTVHGGIFTGNTAASGGAISSYPADGTEAPVISGATFTGNSASVNGGAIYSYSIAVAYGGSGPGITASNCAFRGNHASYGGAVWETSDEGGTFSGNLFEGNTAAGQGGGLWVTDVFQASLSQDTFQSNAAAGGDGGGVYAGDAPTFSWFDGPGGVNISGGFIAWNQAGGDGGGMYTGQATVTGVGGLTIKGNRAADGGGIYADEESALALSGVSLTGNAATGDGGGLSSGGTGGDGSSVTLTGTAVTGNKAAAGGGFWNATGSVMTLGTGSSVTGNRPDNCEPSGTVTGCTG